MAAPAAAAGKSASMLRLAVCGLHLRSHRLHWQLTELDAVFVRACNSVSVALGLVSCDRSTVASGKQ